MINSQCFLDKPNFKRINFKHDFILLFFGHRHTHVLCVCVSRGSTANPKHQKRWGRVRQRQRALAEPASCPGTGHSGEVDRLPALPAGSRAKAGHGQGARHLSPDLSSSRPCKMEAALRSLDALPDKRI